MIIPDFKATIGKYNIRKFEEHAYRTTITVANHKMLVMERRNEKFTLEVVDNSQNKWHTIDEIECLTEQDIVAKAHEYLLANCGYTKSHLFELTR